VNKCSEIVMDIHVATGVSDKGSRDNALKLRFLLLSNVID
jgi:hypothetical protein